MRMPRFAMKSKSRGSGVDMLFVLIVGLAAGTISGIVGFGSSIMLMPVLVIVYGRCTRCR
jgi:uncharacterized membrane protein YfcA